MRYSNKSLNYLLSSKKQIHFIHHPIFTFFFYIFVWVFIPIMRKEDLGSVLDWTKHTFYPKHGVQTFRNIIWVYCLGTEVILHHYHSALREYALLSCSSESDLSERFFPSGQTISDLICLCLSTQASTTQRCLTDPQVEVNWMCHSSQGSRW